MKSDILNKINDLKVMANYIINSKYNKGFKAEAKRTLNNLVSLEEIVSNLEESQKGNLEERLKDCNTIEVALNNNYNTILSRENDNVLNEFQQLLDTYSIKNKNMYESVYESIKALSDNELRKFKRNYLGFINKHYKENDNYIFPNSDVEDINNKILSNNRFNSIDENDYVDAFQKLLDNNKINDKFINHYVVTAKNNELKIFKDEYYQFLDTYFDKNSNNEYVINNKYINDIHNIFTSFDKFNKIDDVKDENNDIDTLDNNTISEETVEAINDLPNILDSDTNTVQDDDDFENTPFVDNNDDDQEIIFGNDDDFENAPFVDNDDEVFDQPYEFDDDLEPLDFSNIVNSPINVEPEEEMPFSENELDRFFTDDYEEEKSTIQKIEEVLNKYNVSHVKFGDKYIFFGLQELSSLVYFDTFKEEIKEILDNNKEEDQETIIFIADLLKAIKSYSNNEEEVKGNDERDTANAGDPMPENEPEIEKKPKRRRIKRVKSSDRLTKIARKVATVLGLVGAAAIIALAIKSCDMNKDRQITPTNDNPKPNTEDTTMETEQNLSEDELKYADALKAIELMNINELDIYNENSLYAYAENLQKELAQKGTDLSIDEIINAIKLANQDYDNEPIFDSKDKVFEGMTNIGTIFTEFGAKSIIYNDLQKDSSISLETLQEVFNIQSFGNLSISNLKLDAVNNNYNIYEVVESLLNIMNNKTNEYSDVQRVAANNIYNEIYTRHFRSNTLTPECNLGQDYVLSGVYNVERDINSRLYDGRTNVYGNAVDANGNPIEIDGTYGQICEGALRDYLLYDKVINGELNGHIVENGITDGYIYNYYIDPTTGYIVDIGGTWHYDHIDNLVHSMARTK